MSNCDMVCLMSPAERTKEFAKWNCPILWNCEKRVDTFMEEGTKDELYVVCAVEDCEFTQNYIRNPEPKEMRFKVFGSVCLNEHFTKD